MRITYVLGLWFGCSYPAIRHGNHNPGSCKEWAQSQRTLVGTLCVRIKGSRGNSPYESIRKLDRIARYPTRSTTDVTDYYTRHGELTEYSSKIALEEVCSSICFN
jgi:hypothetical protein